jgi:hypothetical protein
MVYRIKVEGGLDESWSAWLGRVEIATQGRAQGAPVTILTVDVVDQSALFGILDRIRDINLTLISVTRADELTPP